jgi:hypothetical protein
MFINKHVQILLQNNMILEGIVKHWSPHQIVLISTDESSTSVLLHPKEDVRVVKVLHKESDLLSQIPEKPEEVKTQLEKKFDETYQMPSEDELRLKTLADLKSELNRQEKIIIASKLKEHTIGEVKTTKYEQPNIFKKQGSK